MPNSFFFINSAGGSINQGQYGQALIMKRPRGFIFVPSGDATPFLTGTDVAGLKAALQGNCIDNNPLQRWQKVGGIAEMENVGQAPKTQDFAYGLSQNIYSGQYGVKAIFSNADVIRQFNRQKLNGRSDLSVYIWDEDNQIFGTEGDDGSGNTVWAPFSLNSIFAENVEIDTGNGVKPSMTVTFADSGEFNRGALIGYKAGFNVNGVVKNVADAVIKPLSALTTRVVTIAVTAQDWGGTNLVTEFPTILAGAGGPANYVVTDHATGTALTVSTATRTSVNGVDAVTLTMAATGYPSAGGSIDIALAGPSTLATAGMKYYETPQPLNIAV